jgi:hypothetical protein
MKPDRVLEFHPPNRKVLQKAADLAVRYTVRALGKDRFAQAVGNVGRGVPEVVLARLSGWGEAPQWGNAATMASIQGALRASETGDTYLLFALYRDMIMNSLHIQGEMGKRLIAVLGKPLVIQPAEKSSPDDVMAAKLCQEMVANCENWLDGMLHVQMGSMYPVSATEKIFEPVNTAESNFSQPVRYRLKKLVPVNYALFCYRVAFWSLSQASLGAMPMQPGMNLAGAGGMPNIIGPRGGSGQPENENLWWNADDRWPDIRFFDVLRNGQVNWDLNACYKPDPMRHVIHHGGIATASFRDTYGGILRGVLFYWLAMTLGRDWFNSYMFRFGRPAVLAYANTSDKNLMDLLEKTFNQGLTVSGGALVVNKDAKVELLQAATSGSADAFEKFLAVCKAEITTGLLGHSLSTTPEKTGLGSGMAGMASELRDDWREMDNTRLRATATEQIFHPWLRLNGYKGRVIPTWGGASPANAAAFAVTLKTLKEAGWEPADDNEQAVSDKMGFKVQRVILESANVENTNNRSGAGGKPDHDGNGS